MLAKECPPQMPREEDTACPSRPPAPQSEPVVLVVRGLAQEHEDVLERILSKYQEVYEHEGYGHVCIEMRFLKRTQKEIIVRCGKDYRYVVDYTKTAVVS